MNIKKMISALLLLAVGTTATLFAQTAVTVGSQVTDESNIVSGKAYILQSQAAGTGTLPYINDNRTNYDIPMSNACNESSVYYLISNGDGTWKIKNYYTNHFWGVPVYNQAIASVADEASAGAWSLNFSNGIAYPSAPDAENTVRGLDRSSNKLFGYDTGTGGTKQVKIYEVGLTEKGLKKPIEIVSGWYLVKWVDTNSDTNTNYSDDDVSGKYIKNYAQDVIVNSNKYSLYLDNAPTGTDGIALSLIYFEKEGSESGRGVDGYLRSSNGHYVTQTGAASNSKAEKNYIIYRSSSTPNYSVITSGYTGTRYSLIPCGKDATPYIGQTVANKFPVGQFYSIDFSLYGIQPWSVEFDGEEDAQVTYSGSSLYGLNSVYNGGTFFFANGVTPAASDFSAPTRWGLSPDIEVDATNYTVKVTYIDIHKVFTINNTNSNRGALIYNPDASTKYVWSSGKSGTFDASNANSQWVIIPTGTTGQFYLYNVGAGKFAIPTGIAQSADNSWVFSDDAVAVVFENQNDGTKKIKMAGTPLSGSNAAYMAVSNNYTGPIINWNDAGGNFTITKVDGQDQSAAANAAVAKLVKNASTALTAYPNTSGWYIIQIKSASGATGAVGRYVYSSSTLTNGLYPLTFTGNIDIQPSIADPTFLTYLDCRAWNDNDWQMPDGRYLVSNSNNKFPTCSSTASSIIAGYDGGNYFKSSANYFADPYPNNGNYFVGETTNFRTTWNVYPIDLSAAGLVAWQVICDNAPESAQITCSRNDVKGLTAVYKNGYFFLPTGVTPEESDFTLDGASGITIDGTAHTITLVYDPNLAIVADGVIVEQGWQTAGRDSEVMLLRVTAKPFKAATNTTMTVSLKDGSAANISSLKLYEANSSSPEIYSTGTGAPTKTEVATASISGSTATFTIGNLTAGTHYYWIGATVKSDATLGAVIDAAVTGITYTCNENETTLDLTSVGDPSDRGAMVFNTRSYPFLPRDNGSRVYRIPAMVVANDGSIVAAVDKRYDSHTDIGKGHVIDIVVRRSTDGGKTWGEPVIVAKGDNSNDATCGYGDPSLYKDNNGKLYLLFAAGNTGYFYGLKRVCMATSSDNGATWSTPVDLYATGKLQDHASSYGSNTCYGLYDYFVTSGRGLCTSEGYLMALLPAQPYTNSAKTEKTNNSHDYIFYSTDQGATWHISENAIFTGGDEAKVIQTGEGALLGSIRQSYNRGFNTATYTLNNDGTLTFTMGTQWNNSQLNAGGYANNQDIFYYQRESETGKTDVIIHSMTTGSHANLKLYYSTDKGKNWTEFLNVQTKGTRYVTMEKSPSGSLYLLFEDQSLNSAGGYTDYNHYPINFLEITCEQLETLIPTLNDYNVEQEADVKIVSGLNGETTYGSWSGNTWTSNDDSGVAGVTLTMSNGTHDKYSNWNSHYNLAYKPETANTPSTLTLTAPEGYIIQNYTLLAAKASSDEHTYTLTAENGTSITPAFASSASGYTALNVSDVNAKSTAITVNTTNTSYFLAIADFVVNLKRAVEYKVVDSKGNEWASQVVVFNSNSVADEMPVSLKRAFCTYTYYSDAACNTPISKIDGLTAIYVKCEYNGPFEFSTTENPKWYFMYAHKQNDANDYLAYADGNSYGVSAASFKEKYGDTQYHWAFIGSPYEVKVLNRSNNGYLSVGALPTTNTAVETAVVSSDETSNPNNTFSLYGFKSSHVVTTNPFSLCLNAKAGVFVNGANGNLYYHNAVVPDANLELSNWKDAHVMALEVPACYTRSTTEGNFGTICLPYDVISYTGAKFYKVAGKMMDGDALSYITLEEVAEPKGGVGYLFQAEGAELTAYYVETGVLAEIENPTSTGLVGSYESQYIPQGGYMLKNNKVYYVDKENYAKVGVNRAYIDLSNIGEADESQAKLVRLVNGDLATGVSRVQTEVADEAVFNLAGQRVSKTTKGVYIINGKKVAVK